jgi:ubiquinone biosynthesis protein
LKDFSDATDFIGRIRALCDGQTPSELESSILALAGTMGEAFFRDKAAEMLADIIRGAGIIPDAYGAYRQVVLDGILHFISMLPTTRLAGLLARQLCLDEHADAGERLIELARQIPTLHKLGQTVARNRHLDTRVREWLIQLENGSCDTDATGLRRMIEDKLGSDKQRFSIWTGARLLSEASVGAVLPFNWREPESGAEKEGVFKVLKPLVTARLHEELTALDALAEYFEKHRKRYALGEFRFRELFKDVRAALLEETDLVTEQENLRHARRFYRKNKQIRIPRPAPFSSRYFTAMSRIDGGKVTDTLLSTTDRKQAADTIFRAIICAPLFSAEEFPIFHGDPHAGNIFSAGRQAEDDLQIGLLDWSQTGCLERRWRVGILKFIQGVILEDEARICRAVKSLSSDPPGEFREGKISKAVHGILGLPEYRDASLMKKTFVALEQLSFEGVRFHRDLMLFRKSFFTLDGLLHDLDPEFNMDLAVMSCIRDLIVGELPRRIAALLIPISDAPEKYRSLLSNKDLQMLLICQAMEFVRKNAHKVRDFMERHAGVIDSRFRLPRIFSSRTAKVILGLYYLYRMRDAAAET